MTLSIHTLRAIQPECLCRRVTVHGTVTPDNDSGDNNNNDDDDDDDDDSGRLNGFIAGWQTTVTRHSDRLHSTVHTYVPPPGLQETDILTLPETNTL
ncbi:hypothetical protein BO94DRAFT_536332 [Aspergillus sclerotioniger CBS 115572]|uniref:Uncharacterized protein n=1 Tax=Aspergillus sclerotioniger CBS 115572 TaxID=1450535 RepID=A0A317WEC6_9EURO|nr:hypothetical protein BO94DRAFT_536332 [Aspergillus sclerotioniger CBS 115572]PWY84733.1 hypothetical protein BO94DRAFT_536332 [Aspergillus sclerotioniger CBS 115572]